MNSELLGVGSARSPVEPKQVMFSDGIRPGGDLTELDGAEGACSPASAAGRRTKKPDKSGFNLLMPCELWCMDFLTQM